jgi:hypothetical protein
MQHVRSSAVAIVAAAILAIAHGCSGEQPATAAATKAATKAAGPTKAAATDPHGKAPDPHDPAAMGGGDVDAVVIETKGVIEATLNGTPTRFEFLPTGSNVAIVDEAHGVARVVVGGAPTDKGMPMLRLTLDGVRVDRLTLPASFTTVGPEATPSDAKTPDAKTPDAKTPDAKTPDAKTPDAKTPDAKTPDAKTPDAKTPDAKTPDAKTPDAKSPRVRLEYRMSEEKVWRSVAGGSVTIDSYSGKRVKGTFAGKLEPKASAFGPPIELTAGTFDVELRLNGAAPGPA